MERDLGFSTIAYLGDSTTDAGELHRITSTGLGIGLPSSPPYARNFSDGPIYADLVPDLLGVAGGRDLNFAVGGSEIIPNETAPEKFLGKGVAHFLTTVSFGKAKEALQTKIDLEGQVDRLLADTEGMDRSTLGVSIFGGLNDILGLYNDLGLEKAGEQADAFARTLSTALYEDVTRLFDNGVGTVILNLLPAGDLFPHIRNLGPEVASLGAQVVEQINSSLRTVAETLPEIYDLRFVDMGLIAEEVRDDPSTYGFQLVDAPLYKGVGGSPFVIRDSASFGVPKDQVMFLDEVHTTREFQEIWAIHQAESLTSMVTVGSDRAETLILTAADDLVFGLEGNDTIHAGGGNDVVLAGIGHDIVEGGAGSDILSGGSGNDVLRGGTGDDFLSGGSGNDLLHGGRGNDFIVDGDGSDFAFGGTGDDIFLFVQPDLMGGQRDDRDVFDGGEGFDTLVVRVDGGLLAQARINEWFGGSPQKILDQLGITANGIESIEFVGYNEWPSEITLPSTDLQARLSEAELWNFV